MGVYIPPKSVQVNFLCGRNDLRTAIEHAYWSFIPSPKNLYPPKQISGYAPACDVYFCDTVDYVPIMILQLTAMVQNRFKIFLYNIGLPIIYLSHFFLLCAPFSYVLYYMSTILPMQWKEPSKATQTGTLSLVHFSAIRMKLVSITIMVSLSLCRIMEINSIPLLEPMLQNVMHNSTTFSKCTPMINTLFLFVFFYRYYFTYTLSFFFFWWSDTDIGNVFFWIPFSWFILFVIMSHISLLTRQINVVRTQRL